MKNFLWDFFYLDWKDPLYDLRTPEEDSVVQRWRPMGPGDWPWTGLSPQLPSSSYPFVCAMSLKMKVTWRTWFASEVAVAATVVVVVVAVAVVAVVATGSSGQQLWEAHYPRTGARTDPLRRPHCSGLGLSDLHDSHTFGLRKVKTFKGKKFINKLNFRP